MLNNAYFVAGRIIVNMGLKLWLPSIVAGPLGLFFEFTVGIFVGKLLELGILKADFTKIDLNAVRDGDKYKAGIDLLNSKLGEDSPRVTSAERKEIIRRAKQATKDFISIRKYLKDS